MLLAMVNRLTPAQPTALFVFVPFCKIKCTYCDFNAYANLARVMQPYAEAVVQEIRSWSIDDSHTDGSRLGAKSIYLGGGTPSLVPVEHIENILSACRHSFDVGSKIEITLEANPGTVDERKLESLLSLGINRLSLGVQSFDDVFLKRLNRGHTSLDALQTFGAARKVGLQNINLDLIFALPLQTLEDWARSLDQAIALQPEHLSLYALTVEEGTGLAFQIKRGRFPMPDDDLAAEMYMFAEDRLAEAGYDHYEISNWARRDATVSRATDHETATWPPRLPRLASTHNLTYWRNEPYVGFGAGAHSCFAGRRYWNVSSPVEYIQRMKRGEKEMSGSEEIGQQLEMAETVILALRTSEGIEFARFTDRYRADLRAVYAEVLEGLVKLGLVEFGSAAVRLTSRGRLLSNQVFMQFLPD